MRAAEKFADPNADFIAGDGGSQQVAPGRSERLRNRERRREHDGAGMEHGAVVHVVLLGEMRGGGVDHRGEKRGGEAARDQHLGRAADRPHLQCEPLDRLDGTRTLARERGADPVEQQVFGAAHDSGGDIVEAELACESGERRRRMSVGFRHQITFAACSRAMSSSA